MYAMCIHGEDSYKEEIIENYYKTNYDKNALLIYIVHPFIFPDSIPAHTNQVEAVIMADVLCELGYNVDIINTKYIEEIDVGKYQLVLGYGKRFDEICVHSENEQLKVCYLTEASPYFANNAELKRLRAFEKRNNCWIGFERQSVNLLNLDILNKADAAICLGNDWTASTYEGMFKKIYKLNVSGFQDVVLPELHKEHATAMKNFLWYGGAGPIHKGLDLLIEAFRKLPDARLHIVGEVSSEFYRFYKNDIENAENILYYGFLNKESEEFRMVCETCGFCLNLSCSEGQSTAVVTTLFAGMIPVCTKETGIDAEVIGGFFVSEIENDEIIEKVRSLMELSEQEWKKRQEQIYNYAKENHTIDCYQKQLKGILEGMIADENERKGT